MFVQTELSQRIIEDVYSILGSTLRTDDTLIDSVMSRILEKRGKCIRPLFMALTSEIAGGAWEQCREAAAVIEAIHLASLLHDDVVDCSDLRRGTKTVNASHSDKISILYGDYIFVTALRMAQELDNPEAVKIIFDTMTRMVCGEISDTFDNGIPDENTYVSMIGNKTASLFALAGELSVMSCCSDSNMRKLARDLGESVGIMFQIVDDALDYNGDHRLMGKPTGADVSAGHITLPLIYSLKDMTPDEQRHLMNDTSHDELYRLVRDRGGVEYALEKAREFSEQARTIITELGNNLVTDKFEQFLDLLLYRHA